MDVYKIRDFLMIKNKLIAIQINQLMMNYSKDLNKSLLDVQKNCDSFEFEAYRLAVGKILGEMLIEVMNPLYLEYPDLKPEGWDDE